MPLYEYECDACEARFELIRKFSDPPVDACAMCGKGPVRRLLSSPAIQFKGSGWYITDYAQKGKPEKSAGEKAADDGKGGTAPAPDKASKTESPPAKSDTAAQVTSQKSQGSSHKTE